LSRDNKINDRPYSYRYIESWADTDGEMRVLDKCMGSRVSTSRQLYDKKLHYTLNVDYIWRL